MRTCTRLTNPPKGRSWGGGELLFVLLCLLLFLLLLIAMIHGLGLGLELRVLDV